MLTFLLLAALSSGQPAVPTEAMVQQALTNCPNRRHPDERLVRGLFELEAEADMPDVTRGLLAAAACHESSFHPAGKCGDGGTSCGLLQFKGWAKRGIRKMGATGDDPRLDWKAAARYWLKRVKRAYRMARRDCRGRGGYRTRQAYLWASANKTATWSPKCGRRIAISPENSRSRCVRFVARCSTPWNGRSAQRGETKHWWRLRLWKRAARGEEWETAQARR